jgi:hypothetical protein
MMKDMNRLTRSPAIEDTISSICSRLVFVFVFLAVYERVERERWRGRDREREREREDITGV